MTGLTDTIFAVHGPTNPATPIDGVRRYGSAVALRPEMEQRYRELHSAVWPTVLDRLSQSNIRNYSIYTATLAGTKYLFSYFEYVGTDFDGDMAMIAADPTTQEWWVETDPCQERLPDTAEGDQWLQLESVFYAGLDNRAGK